MSHSFVPLVSENLELRFARDESEIRSAQKLRYSVFMEEMGAQSNSSLMDTDSFDLYCNHLLVIDRLRPLEDRVVGTYRLLGRDEAAKAGQFYSASEYDLTPLLAFKGNILEVGRSCVHKEYRKRATMQLLWRGLAEYALANDIDILFGCASFPGVDIEQHRHLLSFLHHYHLAPPALRVHALPLKGMGMNLCPLTDLEPNLARCIGQLPPLIKGYLRVGGLVGADAVVDSAFNTTDIFILVQMQHLSNRYDQRFRPQGSKE